MKSAVSFNPEYNIPVRCTIFVGAFSEPLYYTEFTSEHTVFEEVMPEEHLNIDKDYITNLFRDNKQFCRSTNNIDDIIAAVVDSDLFGDISDSITIKHDPDVLYCCLLDNQLLVSPYISEELALFYAVRLLRTVQYERKLNPQEVEAYTIDTTVFIHRVMQADLDAITVKFAWELNLQRKTGLWELLKHSGYLDLCMVMRQSAHDFRNLKNGESCSMIFESWFMSNRINSIDRGIVRYMLANYRFEGNKFVDLKYDRSIILKITEVNNKSYLSRYINHVLNDAVFTEIRDRSVSNFVWFMKFELSFREAEKGTK